MGAAVAGVLLGLAGLAFGIVSKKEAEKLRAEFAEVHRLMEKVERVEEDSSGISESATRIGREVESLRRESQEAFDNVKTQLTRFSRDLNSTILTARQLQEKVTDFERMRESVQVPQQVAVVEEAEVASGSETGVGASGGAVPAEVTGGGEERFYTIRSGDTLSRIAANHGVSVAALMAANPEVDERRLQIGEKLRVPAN